VFGYEIIINIQLLKNHLINKYNIVFNNDNFLDSDNEENNPLDN